MRLLVLSDLHRELWREHAPVIDMSISRPDLVILAGDIDIGAKAIHWAAQTFSTVPVLYVHGNHEAYGKNLEDSQKEIQEACALVPNVHFLNCREYVYRNVRFLGATMWTDFCLFGEVDRQGAIRAAEAVMLDYKRIRLAKNGYRKLRATDTAQIHVSHRSWLKAKLAEPFLGKTVVITHMAPSMQSVSDHYATDPVSASFASRLDDLVCQSNLWIHGHMHESFDYHIDKCRVVCNPCGYMMRNAVPENENFDPNFVIDLDGEECA